LDIGYCTEIKRSKKKLEIFNEQSSYDTHDESNTIKQNEHDFTIIIINNIIVINIKHIYHIWRNYDRQQCRDIGYVG